MFRLQRVSLMFHRFSLIVGFFDLLSLTRTTGSDTSAAICREIRWIIKYACSWRWISFFLVSFRCTRSWSQNFGIKKNIFLIYFLHFLMELLLCERCCSGLQHERLFFINILNIITRKKNYLLFIILYKIFLQFVSKIQWNIHISDFHLKSVYKNQILHLTNSIRTKQIFYLEFRH